MVSRRSIIVFPAALCCHGLLAAPGAGAVAGAKRVAVVFPSNLDPCAEAADGLRLRLVSEDVPVDLLDINKATFAAEVAQELARMPAVIVAVGSEALRAILNRTSAAIIVSTMTLEADQAGARAGRLHAAVYLDIAVRTLALELRKLFPNKTRVGVIRNPSRGGPSTSPSRGLAADTGALQFADCATPDELLPVFLSFRKKVDFVVCLPDSVLYNGATARPLVLASLENRLPIVGFSPAFLRAGAAVAVYPDYRGIGLQTADVVRRCLEPGDSACWEHPKQVTVALNAKVLRMLGLEFDAAGRPDLVIVR